MRIMFLICLFIKAGVLFAQTNNDQLKIESSQLKVTPISDSTALGKPDGKLVSREIGANGGNITSDDGRVELIFPAGALAANTTISIQPCTNMAPNGVSKAYQFEPSGIQFHKPVKIIIHYTSEEAEICPPEWMSLGIQNDKGKWTFVDYEETDTIEKKLVGYMHHFSFATNVNNIELRPDRMKIAVKDSVMIEVVDITQVDTAHAMVSGFWAAQVNRSDPVLWYANRVLNGDNIQGRIKITSAPLGKQKLYLGQYFAPNVIPKQNAVAIWAEVYRRTKNGKELRRRIKTYIEVYDKYHVAVVNQSMLRAGMGSEMLDSASFDLYVFAHSFQVVNIKNYSPIVLKEGKRAPFKEKIIVGDALGKVHITEGIMKDSLSHDYPPEVYFEFKPLKILVCKFQHGARGIWSDPEPLFEMSVPGEINFIANGQPQRIHITDGGDMDYHLVVTPLR